MRYMTGTTSVKTICFVLESERTSVLRMAFITLRTHFASTEHSFAGMDIVAGNT